MELYLEDRKKETITEAINELYEFVFNELEEEVDSFEYLVYSAVDFDEDGDEEFFKGYYQLAIEYGMEDKLVEMVKEFIEYCGEVIASDEEPMGLFMVTALALHDKKYIDLFIEYLFSTELDHPTSQADCFMMITDKYGYDEKMYDFHHKLYYAAQQVECLTKNLWESLQDADNKKRFLEMAKKEATAFANEWNLDVDEEVKERLSSIERYINDETRFCHKPDEWVSEIVHYKG